MMTGIARIRGRALWLAALAGALGGRDLAGDESGAGWPLSLRHRVEAGEGSGRYTIAGREESWRPRQTAFIVCDMWDLHHSLNATRRVAEMAPRMNELLRRARRSGATIIHAPSSCMKAYEAHPARRRALEVPRSAKLPAGIGGWCDRIPSEEKGRYPLDQSDGGEDDDPREHQTWAEKLSAMGRDPRAPWKSQTALLEIDDADYITDSGEEVWSILEHRGLANAVVVGVHTNMCVLGRPFGLRQMARNGKNVVLMRDLTDTMYNPARWPHVSHFTGTDLIVEHIEKFVCPTITSDQILGGEPFRFSRDRRPHVVIAMAEREYLTGETLPVFALEYLGRDFRVTLVHERADERNDLPGIETLDGADVLLLSVRRRLLPASRMKAVRRFVARGGSVVGIRTASHAFAVRGEKAEGLHDWPELDREVFGGNYSGHHGRGATTTASVPEAAAGHPLLSGIDVEHLRGHGPLYKVSPLAPGTDVLLTGEIPGRPSEPLAWTSRTASGGHAFYTSLGHPDDFRQEAMNRLLLNAVLWAAGVEPSRSTARAE